MNAWFFVQLSIWALQAVAAAAHKRGLLKLALEFENAANGIVAIGKPEGTKEQLDSLEVTYDTGWGPLPPATEPPPVPPVPSEEDPT